jgi:hypothetical protein
MIRRCAHHTARLIRFRLFGLEVEIETVCPVRIYLWVKEA